MSIYAACEEQADECMIYYKEVGTKEYIKGYPMVWQADNNKYAGSIAGLKEDTEYVVSVYTKKDDLISAKSTNVVKTLSSDVPIASTINISDIYTPGTCLDLSGYNGNENGWIAIKGDGSTIIDAGTLYNDSVYLRNSSYIILEDLTINGGRINGINLDGTYGKTDVHHIIIRNCKISNWGRIGTLTAVAHNDDGSVKEVQWVDENGEYINYDSGIKIRYSSDITVERCVIHSPRGDSTPWADTDNGITWTNSHPVGCNGIFARGERVVIRYNDIVGNTKHMFNDAIESSGNFSKDGGLYKDCDVYGNMLAFAQDDAIELDGGQQNVRFFNNRIMFSRTGVSIAQNCVGPSYIFKNLIHDLRDSTGYPDLHIKGGGLKKYGQGITHIFYNTFNTKSGERTYGIHVISGQFSNIVSRNNIIVGGASSRPQIQGCEDADAINDFDYDMLGNHGTANKHGNVQPGSASTAEANAIWGLPSFKAEIYGLYGITENTLGYNSAVKLPGFSGSNMGALDIGENSFVLRNFGVTVDKDMVRCVAGGSRVLNFNNSLAKNMKFVVLKNSGQDSRINLSLSEGVIEANKSISITVTAASDISLKTGQYHDEMIIVKFENGYSIPIGVNVYKQ